jgi:hypothetical protein
MRSILKLTVGFRWSAGFFSRFSGVYSGFDLADVSGRCNYLVSYESSLCTVNRCKR